MKSSGITLIVLWILASTTCVKSQLLNELAAAEPKKFYLAIKKSVAQTWRPIRGISEVSLKACGHRNPSVEADETLIGKLSLLAEEIVELESALRSIPKRHWKAKVEAYEDTAIRSLVENTDQLEDNEENSGWTTKEQKKFYPELAAYLNAVLKKELVSPRDMECGAGGIYLAIETDPQSSRIRYINMHDFNMCGELGIDPTDESRCDKWREYSDGFEFKGNYKVHVAWPDGKVAMRNFPVSLVAKNNVGTIKIKIRPDRSPIIDRSELD